MTAKLAYADPDQEPAATVAAHAIDRSGFARNGMRNRFGGYDLEVGDRMVRVVLDDIDITILAFGEDIVRWTARFTERTPASVIAEAIRAHLEDTTQPREVRT